MAHHWRIESLKLVGKEAKRAELTFSQHLTFVYGASNTGKSFAVKTLDFMLGGSRELPNIEERKAYETGFLSLNFGDGQHVELERALRGGDFQLKEQSGVKVLDARHERNSTENISGYLLSHLNALNKEIAKDKSGTKRSLSFRDLVRFCIIDETTILSENSPVETGDPLFSTAERSTFKFLLTGEDDTALITQIKRTDFKTSKQARLAILEQLISDIDEELAAAFPDKDQLDELDETVTQEMEALQSDITTSRMSISTLINERKELADSIGADQRKAANISIALENFHQLANVYLSDIARLEAIEEAGFLLGMDTDGPCPVCGAPPEAQAHSHGIPDIEKTRKAAEFEIGKIRVHQTELDQTISDAQSDLEATAAQLGKWKSRLYEIEQYLEKTIPAASEQQAKFIDVIFRRDRIGRGQELIRRKLDLEKQRKSVESEKNKKRPSNYQPGLSTKVAQDFADEVSEVLTEWGFPGKNHVVFDIDGHDLIIDGKKRRDNGKGVRAVTHAAFKVALMSYCGKRSLSHPGFLVLDSPLLTYRDPLTSRLGTLSPDEELLSQSNLKSRLFSHLSSFGHGQIILFDNVDPPLNTGVDAKIEAFTKNDQEGRQGFL